jgi:membrane-associated phospholipid phosphatase
VARVLGIGYVLAMAWTLVYGGEHYVFDVLLGWIYAVSVYFGVRWVRARWGERRRRARAAPPTAAAVDVEGPKPAIDVGVRAP